MMSRVTKNKIPNTAKIRRAKRRKLMYKSNLESCKNISVESPSDNSYMSVHTSRGTSAMS